MKQPQKRAQILLAVALLLYACGYVTQFIGNYAVWQKNGGMLGGTSPPFPSLSPLTCLKGVLWFPYNLYCMAGCAAAVAVIFLYRKLFSQDALTDSERNFDFSAKGTYGTSGWMQTREVPAVLDMVSDLSQHTGTVLGMLDGKFLCIPEKTRMNGNLAVYGASGSMKTRSFCMNRILQSAARGESLIICDPKSELYEKSSEYMRDLGYTVRVFNLVSPENSDSWNCLKEIEGQELMAQLFVDVIIKNTNGTGKSDRFWDSGEMNLLKALVLYVDLTYPPEQRTIGEVYNLITQCSESQLDSLFDVLPLTHPAKAPYSLYQRASDSVRSGVISGLGSRLQVFQSELIKKITAYDEISLELPGQQPCAYYLVTSDQDSTFDFLASLFLSFAFIKLVRYADANCPGGRLPVPVHVLGEELTACGTISELSRRIHRSWQDCVQRLLVRGLLVVGTGDTEYDALYDLLSCRFIIPIGAAWPLRVLSFLKLTFLEGISWKITRRLFHVDARSACEKKVIRLARQTPLSCAEIIKCIEMDIRRLKDGYDVLDKLYDDNDLNCDNFAQAVREYRCSHEVITAVANLYLRQQIMIDTY